MYLQGKPPERNQRLVAREGVRVGWDTPEVGAALFNHVYGKYRNVWFWREVVLYWLLYVLTLPRTRNWIDKRLWIEPNDKVHSGCLLRS